MDNRFSTHTVYKTEYHIDWNTKYRHEILKSKIKRYLDRLFPKILETMPGCELIEYNIQPDHFHMFIIIPPKYSVSRIVGRIKGKTSKKVLENGSVNLGVDTGRRMESDNLAILCQQ